MEKMSKKRKSLWMRYVDFGKVRNALCLVSDHNGQLRAKDLEVLGIERGIFRRENGKPFSHTTMYHYRKVMEHLQLVRVEQQRYFVVAVGELTKLSEHREHVRALSSGEKEVFANVIVQNPDCHHHFFSIFSLSQEGFTSIEQFRSQASYITAHTGENGATILKNPRTEAVYTLNTKDKLHAIFWGVRLWALNLEMTDEIFTYGEGRLIFPILKKGSMKTSEILGMLLGETKPTQTWETFSVPELTRIWSPRLRVSTQELHDAIKEVQARFPQFVDFIPTSASFIDIRTPFVLRDNALFKGYMKDSQGRFISHVRLHHNVWKEYGDVIQRRSNVSLK